MSEDPLQLILSELRQVAKNLVALDPHHGRRSAIAADLEGTAARLEAGAPTSDYPPIAEHLKALAKEVLPDDAMNARAIAEACLRLMKLSET